MKRLFIIILLLFTGLFFYAVPVYAESASLTILGGGAKKIGTTFNLTASLNTEGNQICAVTFDITYPANLLELKSANLGSPFTITVEQSSSEGNIHYVVGASGCTTANATLLTMSFRAKTAGNATVAFTRGESVGGADGQQVIPISKGSTTVTMATSTVSTTRKSTNTNTNSTPEVVPIKEPALTKLEYASDAVLDNEVKQAKGIMFYGTADAEAKINIVVASDPISGSVQADASGNWIYILNEWLESGLHTITMTAEKSDQKSTDVVTNFIIGTDSKDQIAIGNELPVTAVSEPASETKSKMNTSTILLIIGGVFLFLIIILLIVFISKRKKYQRVAQELSESIQASTLRQASPAPEIETSNAPLVSSPIPSQTPIAQQNQSPNMSVNTSDQPILNENPVITAPQNTIPQNPPQPPVNISTSPLSPSLSSSQSVNTEPNQEQMVVGYDQYSDSIKAPAQNVKGINKIDTPSTSAPAQNMPNNNLVSDSEITFDSVTSASDNADEKNLIK